MPIRIRIGIQTMPINNTAENCGYWNQSAQKYQIIKYFSYAREPTLVLTRPGSVSYPVILDGTVRTLHV